MFVPGVGMVTPPPKKKKKTNVGGKVEEKGGEENFPVELGVERAKRATSIAVYDAAGFDDFDERWWRKKRQERRDGKSDRVYAGDGERTKGRSVR